MPKKAKKGKERTLLPKKLSKSAERLMNITFTRRCWLWYENFALNLSAVRDGKDVMELPKFNGEPAVIVGGGPSVWKHKHLDLLKKWKHPIFSTDIMLIPLLKRGIKPNIVSSIDGLPMIKKFYDDPIVDKFKDDIKAVLIATIHPEVVKRCPFEKYWYVNIYDDPRKPKSLTAMFHYMSKQKTMLVSMGNVGGFLWNLSLILGCKPIILIGFNYSYDKLDITKASYYPGILRQVGGNMKKAKKYFSIRENPMFKNKYLLDLIWQSYREIFSFYISKAPILTINASEEGSLHSIKNLKQMKFEEVIEKFN